MRASRRSVGRALSAAIVALLVLGAFPVIAGAGTAAQKSPLGTKDPATAAPVKVGLISTGGDCSGCGGQDEPEAANAAVSWLNEYHQGLGGHEMELVTCIDSNDPGKGTDCANQMIREGVAAVVIGSNGILEQEWKILHDAGVAVINHSATNASLLEDTESTFILYDPNAQTVNLPLAVAKRAKAKIVSVIVVDVPTATEIYDSATKRKFKKAGIDLEIIPVPLGAPDMTPQAQQIVQDNPDGVVSIVGHDAFCIPALNGLQAVGFEGTISTISFCITDSMREGAPKDLVEGMKFGSEAPVGDTKDPSMKQYKAVLKKYADEDVDPDDLPALTVFQSFGALSLGTKTLTGEVTPDSVIAALRGMDNEVLPASGGRLFRCNGKASTAGASICSAGTVTATLDADGQPKNYTLDNNKPIGD